ERRLKSLGERPNRQSTGFGGRLEFRAQPGRGGEHALVFGPDRTTRLQVLEHAIDAARDRQVDLDLEDECRLDLDVGRVDALLKWRRGCLARAGEELIDPLQEREQSGLVERRR